MNIDFHVHGILSKKLKFDEQLFHQMIAQARLVGLGAFALTDHFNGNDYREIHDFLDRNYNYQNDYYLVDGVRIYPGVEVDVREGPHLLAIGARDAVATFHGRLADNLTKNRFCNTAEFFDKQADLDLLTILAHPCRPKREGERIDPALYPYFHATGLNGRDLYVIGDEIRNSTSAFAGQHNLPLVAGSDTHHFLQFGCVYNRFHRPFETIADLKKEIAAGAYTVAVDADYREKVGRARETKKKLKAAILGG